MQFSSSSILLSILAPFVAAEFIPYPDGTAPGTSEPTVYLQAALETATTESSIETPLTTDLAPSTDMLPTSTNLEIAELTTTDTLLPATTPPSPANITILDMLLTNQTTEIRYPNTTLAFLHFTNQTTTTTGPVLSNTTGTPLLRLANETASVLVANLSTPLTTSISSSLTLPTPPATTLLTEAVQSSFEQFATAAAAAAAGGEAPVPAKTPSQPSATEQVFAAQISTYVSGGKGMMGECGVGGMILGAAAVVGAAVLGQ